MKKIVVVFLFLCSMLIAENTNDVQLLSKSIKTTKDKIKGFGNVVIFSPQYYLTAKEIVYDKTKKTLDLKKDVSILRDNNFFSLSSNIFINFEKDTANLGNVTIFDNNTGVWIKSQDANKTKQTYHLKQSRLSSCDCKSPLWSIKFTSGDYDTQDKWVNTYNTRLYIKKVPVLYLPWFGFSTDDTRRTGVLHPRIGLSNKEGFLYSQSLFVAPFKNWDFELTPQFRTKRGEGGYVQYRWADSPYSFLQIKTGGFNEKRKYQLDNDIKNQIHKGYNIDYIRDNLFASKDSQDGLTISINDMNDIGYENFQDLDNNSETLNGSKLTSKINYFYNQNRHFAMVEFKYYKDTRNKDEYGLDIKQKEILQQLPKLKYHNYLTSWFGTNFTTSFDIESNNYTNDDDTKPTAKTVDTKLDFSYSFHMFDEFINISLGKNLHSKLIQYNQEPQTYEDAKYLQSQDVLSLSANLLKSFDTLHHTIGLKVDFVSPNEIDKDGDIYTNSDDSLILKPFGFEKIEKNINILFNQSFYDKTTLRHLFNHKIRQLITIDEHTNEQDKKALENEIIYYTKGGYMTNKIKYSNNTNEIISNISELKDTNDYFNLSLKHSKTKENVKNDLKKDETIIIETTLKFNKYYGIGYEQNYNLLDDVSSLKEYFVDIQKRCWAIKVGLKDQIVSTPTIENEATREKILYFNFLLKPIGGIDKEFLYE